MRAELDELMILGPTKGKLRVSARMRDERIQAARVLRQIRMLLKPEVCVCWITRFEVKSSAGDEWMTRIKLLPRPHSGCFDGHTSPARQWVSLMLVAARCQPRTGPECAESSIRSPEDAR